MQDIERKREQEKRIVTEMISLYCRRQHHTAKGHLCKECAELADYACQRSRMCPFMESKTFCSSCRVHCYSPEMREKIRAVMRWSGPRMLLYHPVLAIRHLIETIKSQRKEHP